MYDKQGKKNHRCVIQNRTNVVFHFSVSLGRGGHDDVKNWAGKARETVWRTQQNDRKEKQPYESFQQKVVMKTLPCWFSYRDARYTGTISAKLQTCSNLLTSSKIVKIALWKLILKDLDFYNHGSQFYLNLFWESCLARNKNRRQAEWKHKLTL